MMEDTRQRLVVVAGPTASGKTALAVELARRQNGEVISADSMQVYREPRIGTARPSEEEMGGVPHHLLGNVPLCEPYSVVRYAQEARAAIDDVAHRGRLPILCGGTGMYIQAVTENVTFWDEEDDGAVRARLLREYDEQGGEALLGRLAAIDPVTAARLHPNDAGRIVRALEVYETTGRTMSEQQEMSRRQPSPYRTVFLRLDFADRAVLYDRIDRRVGQMLEEGLEQEARLLLSQPTAPTAMQAIGYKELAPYIAGQCSLDEAVDNLKRATRRYAKRQLSWFRRIPHAHTLYVDAYDSPSALFDAAERILKEGVDA